MDSHHPKKPSPSKEPLCPPPIPLPPRPKPLEQHHGHILRVVMIVMACMLGLIMFLCSVAILMKYFYSRRHNRSQNRRDTPILFDVNGDSPTSDNDDDVDDEEDLAIIHPIWYIRTVGLQQSHIDSITVFKYKKDDGVIDGTECSVCLGEFEHDESLRLLPKCSHAFHIPCIDTWLRSHKNCPLCRAPVLRDAAQISAVDHSYNNNNQTEVNVSDHQSQSQNQESQEEDSDEESGEVRSEGYDVEEETQSLRRAVSVDSFSSSMFRDVVLDLDSHNQNGEKVNSRVKNNNKNKGVSVGKNVSENSNSNSSSSSSGRVMQKRTVSMRRSVSYNRKFLFSRHYRSQSSTLPL